MKETPGPGSLSPTLGPYLTVKEVASITRLSRAKVYSLIEQGVLASVQPPGCSRVLVAPTDLEAYLAAGRKPSKLVQTTSEEVE